MPELLCPICHQSDTCDKFLAQHCGHVFCKTCTTQLSRERKCPTCRSEWGPGPPFRIYLNFPDPDKPIRALDHLENIDKDSPPILTEKAGGILKNLAEGHDISISHDAAKALLLGAAQRLEQRVAPLASELGHIRQENATLRQQISDLNLQLESKDALTTDLNRLKRIVKEREVTISAVHNDLINEKQRRQSEKDTNRRLTRSLRKKHEEIVTKETAIDSLKSEIMERDKQLSLMKSKLRALIKSKKSSKRVQSPDDSLIVERLP